MKEKTDAFFSEYIIDGVQMDATPADLLSECMTAEMKMPEEGMGIIGDESPLRNPQKLVYDSSRLMEYVKTAAQTPTDDRTIDRWHPRSSTKLAIAKVLIDSIWKLGQFRLEDLVFDAEWLWDSESIGNMLAFYKSAEAASQYLYDLGVKLSSVSMTETKDGHSLHLSPADGQEEAENGRRCPGAMTEFDSWLVYIPFETSAHHLGGSLLGRIIGSGDEKAPDLSDPDYFMDCYEVVRELVEDGIVTAGVSVCRGGLIKALQEIAGGRGLEVDLSGIAKAYLEEDLVRIAFAEIPGVLIQIHDGDFDYVDSQLMLQDVAYYPLGRNVVKGGEIVFRDGGKGDIAGLLSALLSS